MSQCCARKNYYKFTLCTFNNEMWSNCLIFNTNLTACKHDKVLSHFVQVAEELFNASYDLLSNAHSLHNRSLLIRDLKLQIHVGSFLCPLVTLRQGTKLVMLYLFLLLLIFKINTKLMQNYN